MSLLQVIAGSSRTADQIVLGVLEVRATKRQPLSERKVRAGLMLKGHTIASFAREHGVSRQLIFCLISGERPGRTGRSAKIRKILEEVSR